jgi:hypothetical protein
LAQFHATQGPARAGVQTNATRIQNCEGAAADQPPRTAIVITRVAPIGDLLLDVTRLKAVCRRTKTRCNRGGREAARATGGAVVSATTSDASAHKRGVIEQDLRCARGDRFSLLRRHLVTELIELASRRCHVSAQSFLERGAREQRATAKPTVRGDSQARRRRKHAPPSRMPLQNQASSNPVRDRRRARRARPRRDE